MKRDFLKKLICHAAITTTLASTLPISVYAASWQTDNMGNYYLYENNSYAVGWRNIDGSVYYFDASGIMQKGWVKYNDAWYFLSDSGALKTGWILYNGEWYYSNSAGIMQTGLLQINGQVYYFGNNGVMKKGSVIVDGEFYTIGSNGAIISNKLPVADKVFDDSNNCFSSTNPNDSSVPGNPNGSKFDNPIVDQSQDGDYDEPARKFTVTFRDENGEELKTKKVKDGDTVKMYEPDDESDDERDFVGWNTKSDGSGKSYDDDEKVKVTKDLTLYAIWSEVEEKTEVSSISISGDAEVEVGKSIQLTADVKPSDATNTKVKWSIVSSTAADAGKATIDSNGVLSGVGLGKITVKAEAADGSKVSSTKEITVVEAKTLITSISIRTENGAKEITADGGTLKFIADVLPQEASTSSVKWKIIEGSEYASIDEDGILKAIGNGKVKVEAVAKDGSGISSAPIEINISGQTVKASRIIVTGQGNRKKISAGGSLIMKARILPDDVTSENMDVEWEAKYTSGTNAGNTADIVSISESEAISGGLSSSEIDGNNYGYARLTADFKGKIEIIARSKKDNSIVGKTTITSVKDAENISITSADSSGNLSDEITTDAGKLSLKALFTTAPNSPDSVDSDVDTTSVKWSIEDVTSGSAVTIVDGKVTSGDLGMETSCDKAVINTSSKTATISALKDGKVRVYAIANDETGIIGYKDIEISGQKVKASSLVLRKDSATGSVLDTTPITIKKGETISIFAEVDDKATNQEVTWQIYGDKDNISYEIEPVDPNNADSKKNKITIKADKALTKEVSNIVVKAIADNIVKECNININDTATDVGFEYSSNSRIILLGQKISITATLYPTYISGSNAKWSVAPGSTGTLSLTNNSTSQNTSTQEFAATSSGAVKVLVKCDGGVSKETQEIKILDTISDISIQSGNGNNSLTLSDTGAVTLDLHAEVNKLATGVDANAGGEYNGFIDWKVARASDGVSASISNGKLSVSKGSGALEDNMYVVITAKSNDGNNTEAQEFTVYVQKPVTITPTP